MAYVTQNGFLWGLVPETTGRVFWVAPGNSYTIAGITYRASDDADGLSPERALRTVNRAWVLATATAGDMIVLLPGDHTTTATIAANKAGVTMTGLTRYKFNPSRPLTTLTISSSADIVTVTAANVEIAWLHFIPVTTKVGITNATATATGMHTHHCSFDLETAAASTATKGISMSAGGTQSYHYVHDCIIYCDAAQGPGIDLLVTTTAVGASLVERCTFIQSTGTWGQALRSGPSTDSGRGNLIRKCDFIAANDAVMTVGIGGNVSCTEESVHIHDCFFTKLVTVPVDTYNPRGAEIAENYKASTAGDTAGGVLITVIT